MDKLLLEFIDVSLINPQANGLWQVEFPILNNQICYINDCSGSDDIGIKIKAYNYLKKIIKNKSFDNRCFVRDPSMLYNN